MTTSLTDVGALIGWAYRPKESPRRNVEYRAIVQKYLDDKSFADAVHGVAAGLGLSLHVDAEVGVVASPYLESPLRISMAEFGRQASTGARKALVGLVLLGVARCAYPDTADLDDTQRIPRVSVSGVSAYLTRTAEEVSQSAPDPEADSDDLSVPWRLWLDMKETRASGASTHSDRKGLVRKACLYLADKGYLTHVSDDDGGTFRATSRLRHAAGDLAVNSELFTSLVAPQGTDSADGGAVAPQAAGLDAAPAVLGTSPVADDGGLS